MDAPIELSELMECIRAAVAAQSQSAGRPEGVSSETPQPALPSPLAVPVAPRIANGSGREGVAAELALTEAVSLLPQLRQKNEVGAGVPKALRSLYRNQGGFNGILLEILDRILESNRQLQRQNQQLYGRIEAIKSAQTRQHEWIASATQWQGLHTEWMKILASGLLVADSSPASAETHGQAPKLAGSMPFEKFQERLAAVRDQASRLEQQLKELQTLVSEDAAKP